jgi:mannose-6-phosphate isomerase-like protein (cupin superfamily)
MMLRPHSAANSSPALCEDRVVAWAVFQPGEVEWEDRGDGSGRAVARLSDAMTTARANIWRYPAGARGKRHADRIQEETFVVLAGMPAMYLGEPPERVDLSPGSVVVVQPGTPLQIWNDADEEATLFIVGAPPEQGGADFLPDVSD